ncbi:hypothetical protein GJ496_008993 [Pomphorhynchus laevis]|nr:hypothetical protein GJ496_008993 [Pomphorhynchus laevis]
MTTYPVSQNSRTQGGAIDESNRCPRCKCIKRKRFEQCGSCDAWFHLSCVGLTRSHADLLPIWLCPACRGNLTTTSCTLFGLKKFQIVHSLSLMEISFGILKNIVRNEDPLSPVVQILGLKIIEKKIDQSDRYRLLISDGKYQHSSCMLGTQLNHLVQSQEVVPTSIVRMDKYICNCVDMAANKYVIIVLEMTVLKKQCAKLGQPTPLVNALLNNFVDDQPAASEPESGQKRLPPPSFSSAPSKVSKTNVLLNASRIDPEMKNRILTIDCLNPYHNKWTIKARITNKSAIRKWSNTRGEGRLFSFDILDNTGEMRVTAFNEECDKFFDLIEIDKVYFISKGKIKPANRQFTSLQNDYEMTLGFESALELCEDCESELPKNNFNFVQLKDIVNKENNDLVDIIAIARSSSDVQTIITRSTNKEITKREISLIDDTASISCTFWGAQAEQFEIVEPKILALKGVRVTDFSGRSLSVINNTLIAESPDVPECRALKSWYDREGGHLEGIVDLSSGGFGFQPKSDINDYNALKNLGQIDKNDNSDEQADYFNLKCVIIGSRKENALYKSCPNAECNKKVIDQNDGTYRCEKCNKATSDYKWRYILQLNIADFVGNRWITCFNDVSEQITGIGAEQLGSLKETGGSEYDDRLLSMNFSEYVMRLRSKLETYNDERRVKLTCLSVIPLLKLLTTKQHSPDKGDDHMHVEW